MYPNRSEQTSKYPNHKCAHLKYSIMCFKKKIYNCTKDDRHNIIYLHLNFLLPKKKRKKKEGDPNRTRRLTNFLCQCCSLYSCTVLVHSCFISSKSCPTNTGCCWKLTQSFSCSKVSSSRTSAANPSSISPHSS